MHKRSSFLPLFLVIAGIALGLAALNFRGAGSTMSMAANVFLGTLDDSQKKTVLMEFDDPKRLDWHFIPKPERKGLQIKHMNEQQREAAHALLKAGISELGHEKTKTIMELEKILHELEKSRQNAPIRDHERYYFTIFGTPGEKGKWGLSVEGHHLSLNFVVEDGVLTSDTPYFFGANPATVTDNAGVGPDVGTRVLVREEQLAFDLLKSLTAEQRTTAMIAEKAPADIRGVEKSQPTTDPAAGLSASKMNETQQGTLRELILAYTENRVAEVSADEWKAIEEAGIDKIHFAWAGATEPGIGHYYRIQGPTFLIEFVNTQPDAKGNPANHIHSVWRDMRGDFAIPNQ